MLDFQKGKEKSCKYIHKKPTKINDMIYISEILSKSFEFARIDLYMSNDKIYFGEITFIPAAGNSDIKPIEYDYKLGKYWK